MITSDNIDPINLIIAKLKQKGLKNKDIAAEVFPQLPPKSAEVKVSRYLNKGSAGHYLSQSKEQAIKELKLNYYELLTTFTDALSANKTVVVGQGEEAFADILPDHTTRMAAARELLKHMPTQNPQASPLQAINLDGVDEVQLVRLLKSRVAED